MASDQAVALAIELLERAPISGDWPSALSAVVAAVGGSCGRICSMSPHEGASYGIASGVPPDALKLFNTMKGADPDINPRAAAIYAAPPRAVVAENGGAGPSGFHRDYYHRFDAPFACFARLDANEDETCVVKIFRSAAMGPVSKTHCDVFAQLLPHVERALAAHAAVSKRLIDVASKTWDEAAIAAFYCNSKLGVRAMSEHGARAAEASRIVSLTGGRLRLANPERHRKLVRAAAKAANPFAREQRTGFSASSTDGALSCKISVAPAPESWMRLSPNPEVLVLLLNFGSASNLDALRAAGLTEAEVDIARRLLEGHTTREIAKARRAAIATVQTQIKAMHGKLGVTNRAELIRVLRDLISS